MADITALKNRIRAAIKANDNQEITGPVLQQALLDIVDELNGATETEAGARQNGDSTLSGMINAEKTRAEGAENTLQQNITAEKNRAEGAESVLRGLIDGITENIENGYMYAGIATPSSTPATGKVFYLALTAGTYTNFGNTEVSQGINILKYNGSAWSLDAFISIDENANIGGNGVVKGNGIATELLKLGINTLGWTKNGINYSTGAISPNNDRRLSELVPIINECLIQIEDVETITSAYGIVWYNEDKEFISGIGWQSSLVYDITSNAPSSAKYFRIFVNATEISSDNVFVFTTGSLLYNYMVDELNGATETEAGARQNGDRTLFGMINAEKTRAEEAETQLNNLITGIKNNIDNGYVYAGIATPSTMPVSGKVFYIATAAGTYTNFSRQVLTKGINILRYNGSAWSSQQLIGIDDEPTADSNNLVTSGGIVGFYGGYVENPEWRWVITDSEKHVVAGIKANGEIEWVLGVPTPIKNYIKNIITTLKLLEIKEFLGNLVDGESNLSELLSALSASLETKEDKVVGKGLVDSEFSNNVSYEENPEFATAEVDSEKKLLGGRKLNGIRFEKIGFETPLLLIGENQCYTYNDTENRETLIVDKDKKVVSYRDRSGVLNEKAGIKTTFLNTRELILSEEGVKNLIGLLLSKGLNGKNNWKNKNIWWCGTSIPAAGFWNVNNAFSYPYMVGEQLGAKKVFNEAVGSSCARKLTHTNSTYEVISRQMGNTISDALAICADTWTIDDANQTVTNGPRTLGITDVPTVSTYSAACYQRMLLLSNSYEIKLVSKYLISDPDENESYLREKFGLLYETLVALHPTAYTYQSDIDLFVIDHGHNDGPTPVPTEDVDSLVMTTFIGAINNYISLIMKYKPHTRIVFISDYDNSRLTNKTIEAQKQIATNWHIPFIDLREYLPFNINVKVKTRGYWATDGIWQEDGFIYDSTAADVAHAFSVNGNAYFPSYVGTTIQEIAEHINPQQDSNGVWWYEYEPRYIYIKDGLHPHTDKSGKCLKLYADVLASFINYVGNNIFN